MKTQAQQFLAGSTTVAPGAKPFLLTGGPVGVLVIHGYAGSIGDYCQFADELHRRGFTVMGMRLAGHGQSLEALRATTAKDWQLSVARAGAELRRHCKNIVVVGSSFGGALAMSYVRNFPDDIQALVVVNPAIRYRAGGQFQTLALRLLRLVKKDHRKSGLPASELERYRQLGSMTHWPIDGILETYRYIRTMVLPQLKRITVPTLVMAMKHDPVVHPDSAQMIHDRVGSGKKKIVWLPGKTHRPFRDDELVVTMVKEIESFLAG